MIFQGTNNFVYNMRTQLDTNPCKLLNWDLGLVHSGKLFHINLSRRKLFIISRPDYNRLFVIFKYNYLEIQNTIEADTEGAMYLKEGTSPMETSDFVHEQTVDIINPAEFELDRENTDALNQHSDHLLFDDSVKGSPSIPFGPESPHEDFTDISNLEPQDDNAYVSIAQGFEENESNLIEHPDLIDFVDNEDCITELTNTDGIVEEPIDTEND